MPTPTACRPFKPSEVPKIMSTFTGKYQYRNKSLLSLGICTGFRISELLALRIDDVYYFGNIKDTIRLPKRLMKGKSPRKPKTIFPEAKYFLAKWIDQVKDDFQGTRRSYLFTSGKGGVLHASSCWQLLNLHAERAGIPTEGIGTHSMRKTFANAVYDYWDAEARKGRRIEPMRMVQRELGHASIEDTYAYMDFKLEEKPHDIFSEYRLMFTETPPEGNNGDNGTSEDKTSIRIGSPIENPMNPMFKDNEISDWFEPSEA